MLKIFDCLPQMNYTFLNDCLGGSVFVKSPVPLPKTNHILMDTCFYNSGEKGWFSSPGWKIELQGYFIFFIFFILFYYIILYLYYLFFLFIYFGFIILFFLFILFIYFYFIIILF